MKGVWVLTNIQKSATDHYSVMLGAVQTANKTNQTNKPSVAYLKVDQISIKVILEKIPLCRLFNKMFIMYGFISKAFKPKSKRDVCRWRMQRNWPQQRTVGRMNSTSTLRADWFRKPPNRTIRSKTAQKQPESYKYTHLIHPFNVFEIKCLVLVITPSEKLCPGTGCPRHQTRTHTEVPIHRCKDIPLSLQLTPWPDLYQHVLT